MEDFRIKTSFRNHPKRKLLHRRCGSDGVLALIDLWSFCTSDHTDGDLSGMSDEAIEVACDWTGEPYALINALVELRLLDGGVNERKLHAWDKTNPWVATHSERSDAAKAAASIRWNNRKCGRIKSALPSHQKGNAPSPSPSPLPSPSPDPNPSQKKSAQPQAATAPAVVEIKTNRIDTAYPVTQQQIDEWRTTFPAVDIMQELRKMASWCEANPTRRKTLRGTPAFIFKWLSREQDKPHPAQSVNACLPPPSIDCAKIRKAIDHHGHNAMLRACGSMRIKVDDCEKLTGKDAVKFIDLMREADLAEQAQWASR